MKVSRPRRKGMGWKPKPQPAEGQKRPINRPCSACSDGDYAMEHHDHYPPFADEAESAEPSKPAKCPTCGSDDKTIHRAYQCGHSDCPCTGYRWHECEDLWHRVDAAQESMNAREHHKWKTIRSKAEGEEIIALRAQVEGLRAALRKVLEATSRPTEYDAWKKAINEAEAALATQLPTTQKGE